ncbi:MAG: branched-chain amino acid ABC transporter permease [Clostridia bacterium]|nr:branched-chain amino acid ABC transporter permease [Clostridia bacterium]
MNLSYFLILLLNGLTFAGLLFVVASGQTLVYGLLRIVNMGHGSLYTLGACIGYFVYKALENNWIAGVIAGGIAMTIIYLFLQWGLFQRVMSNATQTIMVSLGISWIVQDIVEGITKGESKAFNPEGFFRLSIPIGNMSYPVTRLFLLLVAIIECIILVLIIKKTKIGQIIRAGVDDRDMVSALGINIKAVFLGVFAFSGLLVGMGGVMGGTMNGFGHLQASTMQMYSLMIIIVGGRGDILGAGIAAVVIGLLYSFLTAYLTNISMVLIFAFVMLVMIFKPNGLFGKEVRRS